MRLTAFRFILCTYYKRPEETLMKAAFLFAAIALLGACASQQADQSSAAATTAIDTRVAARINEPFRSESLDVKMWAERFEGESREVYAARMQVLEALELKAGDEIADIGAGSGLYVKLFAQSVGPEGTVFANDIAPAFLEFIAERAAQDGLLNVVTVLGEDRKSNLEASSVDVIFHSDVYHHFEYPSEMNADLYQALRPGGRLYVLDFERIEGVSSQQRMEHVRAPKEVVVEEIKAAGFEYSGEIELEGLIENYLIAFAKPNAE
jgi:predicted methyltransferase